MRAALFTMSLLIASGAQAQQLELVTVASGLSSPLFVAAPAGETSRLFILEQNSARIRIQHAGAGLTTFLDLGAIAGSGGEQGLLGLAFDPNYAVNGNFFVNYTDNSGDTVVARYTVSADPDVADAASALEILTISQPFSNHNGGMMAFGPDGMLYIGTGDGGSGGDPGNRSQDGLTLLGKMLRIDVSSAAVGSPYAIPADNPFVGDGSVLDEIWALGLRNPWRFSFDRLSGEIWIGDVGQNDWEEVSVEPAASGGGLNFGWRLKEGDVCFNPASGCDPGGLTDPVLVYAHTFFPTTRCSITGGYVYRGDAMPLLQGAYLYGDYCSREVWGVGWDGVNVTPPLDLTSQIGPSGGLVSFGQDDAGELYVVAGSRVSRIETVLKLSAPALLAGSPVDLTVSGAPAGASVGIGYSLSGTGRTPVAAYGVDAALRSPTLLGTVTADGSGNATFATTVPAGTGGLDVWLQAGVVGNSSNVVHQVVQ